MSLIAPWTILAIPYTFLRTGLIDSSLHRTCLWNTIRVIWSSAWANFSCLIFPGHAIHNQIVDMRANRNLVMLKH